MREILFRGFHPSDGPDTIVVDGEKVKGEWVYGNLFVNKLTGQHMIIAPNKEIDLFDFLTVTPPTVGQYIGLTDRTGERIFEGDKVKGFNDLHQREEEYIVVWACNNGFYFVDDSETEWHPEHIIPCEVIGTVFDEEATNET